MPSTEYDFDVAIVGAGPAGLNAALILARCRRSVIVFDHGNPRNRRTVALHGYLGHDGIPPAQLRHRGRKEAASYGAVFVDAEVTAADRITGISTGGPQGFELKAVGRPPVRVRKLLLATGIADKVPPLANIGDFYGITVHHCPYCDGWEHRDRRLVAFGDGEAAVGLALSLKTWSASVTACTNGSPCSESDLARLARSGIAYRHEPVTRLEGEGGMLHRIVFADGPPLAVDALFFNSPQAQTSSLASRLGCRLDESAHASTYKKQSSGVKGLYLAGDVDGEVQFSIVAAAEGAIAATAINRELQDEATADHGEQLSDGASISAHFFIQSSEIPAATSTAH